MAHDIRTALRSLLRSPGFTVTTVLTLALAAGANAAVLAVVYGVMLKPLPYAEPERLVAVWPGRFQSNDDLLFLRERARSYSNVAAVAPGWGMSLHGAGDPTRVTVAKVSGNLFETLAAEPLLGRPFTEGAARPGADRVVVLTHGFWSKRLGSDESIVGRSILLDGEPFQVAAVMRKEFGMFGLRTDAFVPFALDPAAWYHQLGFSLYVARLAPGHTVEQANREYRVLTDELRRLRKYPDDYGRTARVAGLRESMVGDLRVSLGVLVAAVGFILMIAGANIGTLQLTRAAARSRDIAVRAALGASRWRIIRELLVENFIVSAIGGVVGVLLARSVLPLLTRLLPNDMPRTQEITIDPLVSVIVFCAALLIGLSVGAAPAFSIARLRHVPALRAGASSESPASKRTRTFLVSAEVALAVVLAIAAGLMLQTIWKLNAIDPGFETSRVLSLQLQPTGEKYTKISVADYYRDLLERLRALPGVEAVGAIQHLPFSGYSWNGSLDIQGFEPAPGASRPVAGLRIVAPGYFRAIGQPLTGSDFEHADATQRERVIVNEALARKYYGSAQAAIGRTLRIRGGRIQSPWMTIIGVAGNVRHTSLAAEPVPEIYTAVSPTSISAMMVAIRARTDPMSLVPSVRQTIWSFDRDVPLSDVQTMASRVGASLGRPRLLLTLLGGFASVGLLLAVVGVYGVVAYSVAQRQRELGIRVALGAERARIMRLVFREALVYAAAGLAVGLPASLAASRAMKNLVWGVSATDAATYIVIGVGTLFIACAASLLPALRAARVDPVESLRAG